MMQPSIEAALTTVLQGCGIGAEEPQRRVIRALCAADSIRFSIEQAGKTVMQVIREELWEAHALKDGQVFAGLLIFARMQYQMHSTGGVSHGEDAWRLSADTILQLMKNNIQNLSIACDLLEYAIAVQIHLETQGEVGEHLFSKFFQACESAGVQGMDVAEAQFARMVLLRLPIKQITMGRLMAVCRSSGDGEAAKRVHGYLHKYQIQFNSHSLTQYLTTFLKLEDSEYLNQLLFACEDTTCGMSGKLNRESYQRLMDVRTTRTCQELLRQHMQRRGIISVSSDSRNEHFAAAATEISAVDTAAPNCMRWEPWGNVDPSTSMHLHQAPLVSVALRG